MISNFNKTSFLVFGNYYFYFLGTRESMLGANIISIMDTVITCAPRESAVSSYIWKNGMGKTVYNFLFFYKGRLNLHMYM